MLLFFLKPIDYIQLAIKIEDENSVPLVYPACLGFPLGGSENAKHGEP